MESTMKEAIDNAVKEVADWWDALSQEEQSMLKQLVEDVLPGTTVVLTKNVKVKSETYHGTLMFWYGFKAGYMLGSRDQAKKDKYPLTEMKKP